MRLLVEMGTSEGQGGDQTTSRGIPGPPLGRQEAGHCPILKFCICSFPRSVERFVACTVLAAMVPWLGSLGVRWPWQLLFSALRSSPLLLSGMSFVITKEWTKVSILLCSTHTHKHANTNIQRERERE